MDDSDTKAGSEQTRTHEDDAHEGGCAHRGMGMGARGVTRPMAEKIDERASPQEKHQGHGHAEHAAQQEDRLAILSVHHKQQLWVYWTLVLLGSWTMLAPVTFGHLNEAQWVDPSGGRGVWFSERTLPELRAWLMVSSDIAAGLLLVILGWRSLTPNRPKSLWACCFVGIWLTFAPVLFWAPTAAGYLNDTLIGALVIALTILVPGMPNMILYMKMGPSTPPGWSYNPSSWPQRWIMIVTGAAGWFVSRYIAAFQLGYTDYAWDPFFGFAGGTKLVLNSNMSHMWPISDGALGAAAYTFEFLMGWMGSPSRWRTMPWMVAFFGILVIPLGLTHILLVISQPVVVHHWCTMCLLAAAIMLPMIPLEVDEVVAMGQHLVEARRRGDRGGSLWRIFWLGGTAEGCTPDERTPAMMKFPEQPGRLFCASIWGITFPWTLVGSTVVGVGLMMLPTFFGVDIKTHAADAAHLGGALIVTVSVIAMAEVVRVGRYLNVVLGVLVAIGAWFLGGGGFDYAVASTVLGIVVAALAFPRGKKMESYGLWDRYVR